MAETEDLAQLRLLNLELLRQLWVGQDAVRRLVARAASKSSLDSSESHSSEKTPSPETSRTCSCSQDRRPLGDLFSHSHRGDTSESAWLDITSSRATSLPPATGQHPEPPSEQRGHPAPLPDAGGRIPKSILAQQSKPSKPRVTFQEESAVPEGSWRFRPYLGYDWIAASLESSSRITSKPETFFSTIQKFREENKEECEYSSPPPVSTGLWERGDVDEDHECVYCYRINQRLFPVPVDPGAPCRLCGMPRDQRSPGTPVEPAQVRVSVPFSILDPPHRYRIHRRKSFDASDSLALPRHCLLGWDVLPLKSEKSCGPKNLDLRSSVSSGAPHPQLSAARATCLNLPARGPLPTPMWSELQDPQLRIPQQKP